MGWICCCDTVLHDQNWKNGKRKGMMRCLQKLANIEKYPQSRWGPWRQKGDFNMSKYAYVLFHSEFFKNDKIQSSLWSEELCQDKFKVFVHAIVHRTFYFPSISLVITIHLSHPQESFWQNYSSREKYHINYFLSKHQYFSKISYEASFE